MNLRQMERRVARLERLAYDPAKDDGQMDYAVDQTDYVEEFEHSFQRQSEKATGDLSLDAICDDDGNFELTLYNIENGGLDYFTIEYEFDEEVSEGYYNLEEAPEWSISKVKKGGDFDADAQQALKIIQKKLDPVWFDYDKKTVGDLDAVVNEISKIA
jgi:hypothetical protein